MIKTAAIKCEESARSEVNSFLKSELQSLMKMINKEENAVSVVESDDGLDIEYPIGEVYGFSGDYVQAVPLVFANLKIKHPDIGIWGIVYEWETVQHCTFGLFFHCENSDKELYITDKWQRCYQCGKVVETDAFYNSSQWDSEYNEGNLVCLCSARCASEFIDGSPPFDKYPQANDRVGLNGWFSEEETEDLYENGLEDEEIKNRIRDALRKGI